MKYATKKWQNYLRIQHQNDLPDGMTVLSPCIQFFTESIEDIIEVKSKNKSINDLLDIFQAILKPDNKDGALSPLLMSESTNCLIQLILKNETFYSERFPDLFKNFNANKKNDYMETVSKMLSKHLHSILGHIYCEQLHQDLISLKRIKYRHFEGKSKEQANILCNNKEHLSILPPKKRIKAR